MARSRSRRRQSTVDEKITGIPTRAKYPRQLIIYDAQSGEWGAVDESTDENREKLQQIDYLAVSYRQSDFPDRDQLQVAVQGICESRGLEAYWLDFSCTGITQEEKDTDLYRIADVFREAKETVIMIPDKRDGWKRWGERVWTYPEALLSKKLLCKEGKKWVRPVDLRKVANFAYTVSKEAENRLISYYGTSGKDFARFNERISDLCLAIWARTSGTIISDKSIPPLKPEQLKALEGERVYALMGFLQQRIEPKYEETEKDAFDRLMKKNSLGFNIYPWEALNPESSVDFTIYDLTEGHSADNQVTQKNDHPLKYIAAAKYNDSRCAVKASCEDGTRESTLSTVYEWLDSEPQKRIFWIHGLAGSGKSTIARTIAQHCDTKGILGATFFCSQYEAGCSEKSNVFPTISYQLSQVNETFKNEVRKTSKENKDLDRADLHTQLEKLIVKPLQATKNLTENVVIIDALDECSDSASVSAILTALNSHITNLSPLRFIFTSRPEGNIYTGFRVLSLSKSTHEYSLDNEELNIDTDIRCYLQSQLRRIGINMPQPWPSEDSLDELVESSHGLFIFASTMVKVLEDKSVNDLDEQLRRLLDSPDAASLASPYTQLDHLYLQILQTEFKDSDTATIEKVKVAFGILMAAQEPLSVKELVWFMPDETQRGAIRNMFRDLKSLVSIPDDDDEAIRLIHPSLQSFLADRTRCNDPRFSIELQHTLMAQRCVEHFIELAEEDNSTESESNASDDLEFYYPYSYWGEHIEKLGIADLEKAIDGPLYSFLSDQHLINRFSSSTSLEAWAKNVLLKFLMTSDKLSHELSIALYHTALYLIGSEGKELCSSDDTLQSISLFFSSKKVLSYAPALLEARQALFKKLYNVDRHDFDIGYIYLEMLYVWTRHDIIEDCEDFAAAIRDVYDIITDEDVLKTESKRSGLGVILETLAKELQCSFTIEAKYSTILDSSKLTDTSPVEILGQFKDLIHSTLQADDDRHDFNQLYNIMHTSLYKRFKTVKLSKISEDERRAILFSLFLGSRVLKVKDFSSLMTLLSLDSERILGALSISPSIAFFVLSPSENFQSDCLPILEQLSGEQDTGPSHLECSTYGQVLKCKKRFGDKHGQIDEHIFFNYSAVLEMSENRSRRDGTIENFAEDSLKYHSDMARRCLEKVTEYIRALGDTIYKDSKSASVDLNSTRSDFKESGNADDDAVSYVFEYWQYHLKQCMEAVDESMLTLLEDLLSLGDGLLCCTKRGDISEVSVLLLDIFEVLSKQSSASDSLMELLYEKAVYFNSKDWVYSTSYYDDDLVKFKILHAREVMREQYSFNDGFYDLDTNFPYLQVALLAYRDGYIDVPEDDDFLKTKCHNMRRYARKVHKMILARSAPENPSTQASLKEHMLQLYKVLDENSATLYGSSDDDDDDDILDHLRNIAEESATKKEAEEKEKGDDEDNDEKSAKDEDEDDKVNSEKEDDDDADEKDGEEDNERTAEDEEESEDDSDGHRKGRKAEENDDGNDQEEDYDDKNSDEDKEEDSNNDGDEDDGENEEDKGSEIEDDKSSELITALDVCYASLKKFYDVAVKISTVRRSSR